MKHRGKNRARWIWISLLLICFFFPTGLLIGAILGFDPSLSYLDLQSVSDDSHRLVILVLPICLASVLSIWVMGFMVGHPRWLVALMPILFATCLTASGGLLGFIIRFDRTIEQKGTSGQLVIESTRALYPYNLRPFLGPFAEVPGVGITTPEIEGGDVIVLEQQGLARKTKAGTTRWSRKRPGRASGSLMLAGDLVLYLGPGPDFHGDVVITAIDITSGRLLWSFHCLGYALHATPVSEGNLFYVAERPSISSLGTIRLVGPKVGWSVQLPKPVHLPPRIMPKGIEVASGSKLYLFEPRRGVLLSTNEACRSPETHGVSCAQERIRSFIDLPVKQP